jgi:purine nucleosidase/pyrimidine-specific ribonucleoside hydrolase
MATRCVLDCDPGHDDAIAIIAAVAAPQLDLRAITTVAGNGTLQQTTVNARKVAALVGTDVPIAAGAAGPLRGEQITAHDIHGKTAMDGTELSAEAPLDPRGAVRLLGEVIAEGEEPTTVIATGPLTNVAQLLRDVPSAPSRIREIVLMGGSTERGNTTPAAEFNIYADPEAAALVFESGLPVRMAGLNLTHQAIADADVRARIDALGNEVSRAVVGWLDFFADTYRERFGFAGPPIHDACAVAWVAEPELVESTSAFVAVELDGTWTRGATVVDLAGRLGRAPNAEVGMRLVCQPFWDFIVGTLAP